METADAITRRLERELAASPTTVPRLALSRAYARSARPADALRLVEEALAHDPLSTGALSLLDELLASPLASRSPWPTVDGGNDRARRAEAPGAREGRVVARIRIGAAAHQRGDGEVERATSLTVGGDGTVYVATRTGSQRRLIALELASGEPRWVREDLELAFAAPTVGAGERLALASGGTVRLLDGRTGETLWIARTGGVQGDPLPGVATFAPGGLLLAPGLRGALYALDAATGALRWAFGTRGAQYRAPAVGRRSIHLACALGGVYSLDLDGRLLGEARVASCHGVTGAVLARDDLLLVQHADRGKLSAVRIQPDGRLERQSAWFDATVGTLGDRSPRLLATSRGSAVVADRPSVVRVPLDGGPAERLHVASGDMAAAIGGDAVHLKTLEDLRIHATGRAPVTVAARGSAGLVAIGPDGTTLVPTDAGMLYVVR